jgi:catechol 2,3-dioxygenase-like lactoylglutathione lyase family enzyme
MLTPNYLLVAVQDPRRSAVIYDRLLGLKPVENSETFVLYVFPTGFKLGLWKASTMEPKPSAPGGVELAFSLENRDSVLRTYDECTKIGLRVVQEPTDMEFGFTFVVEDPDGHRLRPFVLAANPR